MSRVTDESSGDYTCRAMNEAGAVVSTTATLTVVEDDVTQNNLIPPTILQYLPSTLTIMDGEEIIMKTQVRYPVKSRNSELSQV